MPRDSWEQAVVHVIAIRAEDRLAPNETQHDRDARVEERDRERHERRRHAEQGRHAQEIAAAQPRIVATSSPARQPAM